MTDTALDRAYQPGMGAPLGRFPTPLDRLIHLRTLPNLTEMQRSGLAFIAQRSEERFYAKGELIHDYGDVVDLVHFVVEGRVQVEQQNVQVAIVEPPFAVGFLPVLASEPVHQRMTALEDTVALVLSAADVLVAIEQDFLFLEAGLRQLTRQLVETQGDLERRGQFPRSQPIEVPYPKDELDLIQRIVTARRGPLADANLEPLVQLVRQYEEVRVEAGHLFWEQGDESTSGLLVVYGVVLCESADREFRMGPDSSVGQLEVLAKLPRSYRALAETAVVALRDNGEDFFDVLEDHFELAMAYTAFVSDRLIELNLKRAQLDESQRESIATDRSDANP